MNGPCIFPLRFADENTFTLDFFTGAKIASLKRSLITPHKGYFFWFLRRGLPMRFHLRRFDQLLF